MKNLSMIVPLSNHSLYLILKTPKSIFTNPLRWTSQKDSILVCMLKINFYLNQILHFIHFTKNELEKTKSTSFLPLFPHLSRLKGTREDDLDDEYFEKDEDEYQNKPTAEEDDEIDPLDAYMNNLDENVKKVEHLVHDNKKVHLSFPQKNSQIFPIESRNYEIR